MKEHHPHLWRALHRVHFSGEVDPSRLDEWRRAPEDSQEYALAENYDRALGHLGVVLE